MGDNREFIGKGVPIEPLYEKVLNACLSRAANHRELWEMCSAIASASVAQPAGNASSCPLQSSSQYLAWGSPRIDYAANAKT